jgi:hypothetical protein
MTADAAAASDQREQRTNQREQGQQEGGRFPQSVMLITRSHFVVHRFNAPVQLRVPQCTVGATS